MPWQITVKYNQTQKSFTLNENDEISIGRDDNNDITIKNNLISKKHLKLKITNNKVILTDLNSTNGTFYNNQKLSSPLNIKPNKEHIFLLANKIPLKLNLTQIKYTPQIKSYNQNIDLDYYKNMFKAILSITLFYISVECIYDLILRFIYSNTTNDLSLWATIPRTEINWLLKLYPLNFTNTIVIMICVLIFLFLILKLQKPLLYFTITLTCISISLEYIYDQFLAKKSVKYKAFEYLNSITYKKSDINPDKIKTLIQDTKLNDSFVLNFLYYKYTLKQISKDLQTFITNPNNKNKKIDKLLSYLSEKINQINQLESKQPTIQNYINKNRSTILQNLTAYLEKLKIVYYYKKDVQTVNRINSILQMMKK